MHNFFIGFIFFVGLVSIQSLNIDGFSKVSFYFLDLVICISIYLSLNNKVVNIPFLFLNIFFLLFFLIAPVSQLSVNSESLINTLPINPNEIILGNIVLGFHILGVILGTFGTFQKSVSKICYKPNKIIFKKKNMLIFFMLTIIVFVPMYIDDIQSKLSTILISNEENDSGNIQNLIWNKTIKIFPLFFVWYFFKKYHGFGKYILLILSLTVLFLAKNPIVEHRNSFGAVFLFCGLLFAKKTIIRNRIVQVSMFMLFPLVFSIGAFLAPHRFKSDTLTEEIFSQFNTVHFDAWANYIAAFNFVKNEGFFYGEQLLGALLFWFPRSIWEDKPIGTGIVIGEYLMEKYNHWFSNISSTFPLEGYIDFGILGVIIYGIIIGQIIKRLSRGFESFELENLVSILVICNIFFLYRGPLLSSLAFTFGGCLGLFVFIKLAQLINKFSFK